MDSRQIHTRLRGYAETLRRWMGTLRHARPVQIRGRLAAPARRRLTRLRLPDPPAVDPRRLGLPSRVPLTSHCHDPWNDPARLKAGEFRFLGRSLHLGWPPDWRPEAGGGAGEGERQRTSLLWLFNLHYHQYLHLLEPADRLALCRQWVERNPVGRGAAWHPYVVSRRIASWCRAFPPDRGGEGWREWEGQAGREVGESLWRQAAYLARNVEWHVLGNHLLDNARALVLAAAWFGDRPEVAGWRALGLRILRDQTPEQVLADGFHFERSPMYQAEVLAIYLDVLNVLPEGHSDRARLEEAARRLGNALGALTHPDGGIALLNDAALEVAPPPARLLEALGALTGHEVRDRASVALPEAARGRGSVALPEAARGRGSVALPEAGYFVWSRGPVWLVVDGGPIGPDHLAAHAHADIFTYELSLGGRRFVVDTGVSTYTAGPERDWERGTRAHNTVCVDGLDQAEVWGSFRVARRWPPENVRFSVDGSVDGSGGGSGGGASGGGGFRFEGEFGGWAKLIEDGIRHRRVMTGRVAAGASGASGGSGESGGEIAVEDLISGRGAHRVESRIHLHPEVRVERDPEADGADGAEGAEGVGGAERVLRLSRDGVEARLVVEEGWVAVEDSVYCPRFGEAAPSKAVLLSAERLPARLAYRIVF